MGHPANIIIIYSCWFAVLDAIINSRKLLLHRRRCRNSSVQSHKIPAHKSFQKRRDGRLGTGQVS